MSEPSLRFKWGAAAAMAVWLTAGAASAQSASGLGMAVEPFHASERHLVEEEWARRLVEALGLEDGLPANPKPADYYGLLCVEKASAPDADAEPGEGLRIAHPVAPTEPGEPVRVKKVLFHLPDALVPAWQVELLAPEQAYMYVVDAKDGRLLFRHDIMVSDIFNYRVFAETAGEKLPHDGPHAVTSPATTSGGRRLGRRRSIGCRGELRGRWKAGLVRVRLGGRCRRR